MQALKLIKFAQSIKIGTEQEYYFHEQHYDIVLAGIDVHITRKKDGKCVSSTLMNAPYFELKDYSKVFKKDVDDQPKTDKPQAATKTKTQSRKGVERGNTAAETQG